MAGTTRPQRASDGTISVSIHRGGTGFSAAASICRSRPASRPGPSEKLRVLSSVGLLKACAMLWSPSATHRILNIVVLSGGVFQNELLLEDLKSFA